MATKGQGRTTLTPRLRFLEFRKAPSWAVEPLGRLFAERQETGFPDLPLLSITDRDGVIPQEETNRTNTSNADKARYLRVVPGDIAYNTMRMWEGRSARVGLEGLVSPAYTVCQPEADTDSVFFAYYFKTLPLVAQFRRFSQGLVKDTLNLKYEAFSRIPVGNPSAAEQRKIAACLTSLDELLAAEGWKLQALRAHKKGLMQQLFPRQGESSPRLRFPAFRDAGEWEETRLGQLGKLLPGLTYRPADVRSEGLLVLRSSNIQGGEIALDDRVYVTPDIRGANLAQPNDILICVRNGSKPLIGKNALIPNGMPQCTHGAFMTVLRAKVPHFVFQLLQTSAYYKQVAADLGATINSINGSQLLKYRFRVPEPAEQHRIAACLSSLDAAIAAASRKLESLRVHKKGLMQQLFPVPQGV
jgi:type I restriction enzyme, S subunit